MIPARRLAVLALAATLVAARAMAGEDQDEARRLEQAGVIQPLERVLDKAQAQHPGRVVRTELERRKGRYIYEIMIVNDEGVVWEVKYDARTAELIKEHTEP